MPEFVRAERILHELATETSCVRWHQLDHELHSVLYAPADRPKLLELIEAMRGVLNHHHLKMMGSPTD